MSAFSILVFLIGAIAASDVTREIEYASALRAQGLYRLSELQCRTILRQSQLEEGLQAQATIELSKTLVARALNSRPPQRDVFWQQATTVLQQALRESPEQPTHVLLQTQMALTALQQGAWSRREADAQGSDDAGWEPVREQLRQAIKLLRAVQQQLTAPRMRAGDQGLSNARVEELLRAMQYQLSRGYRNQALTYPPRSKDRINSLTLAVQQLQTLATSSVADDVVWQSKIDLIQCYRQLGELERTRQLIAQASDVPDKFVGRLAAEGIRLALDAEQPKAAMKLVQNPNITADDPEFELARIEAIVAAARRAEDAPAVKRFQQQAAEIATVLGQNHGTYWGLRGEMLIARLAVQTEDISDTTLLDTAAKTFLQRDLPEDATEMFIRAARQAEEQGDGEQAFDFRHKAATVDHQQGNLQAAVDRFRDVALKYPENIRASETHLLAVFDSAALYQQWAGSGQMSSAEKALAQYQSLLHEHLARWPDEKSADQARLWLGQLAAARRDTDLAMRVLRQVKSGSPLAPGAYARLGDLYEKTLRPSHAAFPAQLESAREYFHDRFQVAQNSTEILALARESARLGLLYDPPDYGGTEKLLRRSLPYAEHGSDDAQQLNALLVVAMAGQSQVARAQAELSDALPLAAAPLTEILRGLQPIRDQRPSDAKLQELIGDILRLLNTYRNQLSESDRLLVAQAVADIATVEQAKVTYARLAEENPSDSRIQLRYAELLSLGRDRQARLDALAQWRAIVSQNRTRSRNWFRAKLGVAQTHFDMGQHDKAKEIVELIMSLHPELGGSGLKQDYLALLAKCED